MHLFHHHRKLKKNYHGYSDTIQSDHGYLIITEVLQKDKTNCGINFFLASITFRHQATDKFTEENMISYFIRKSTATNETNSPRIMSINFFFLKS